MDERRVSETDSNEANSIDFDNIKARDFDFGKNFFFGVGSSAYQYEGAASADGKGVSNWDLFTRLNPEKIKDGKNGEVAVDFYQRYPADVLNPKYGFASLGVNAFRLSISWTRILPNGKLSGEVNEKGVDTAVNEEGIQFYTNLFEILEHCEIEPFVTLFHWDVPLALEDEGGFMNPKIIDHYVAYVNICFERFGKWVKHWITFNEPVIFTRYGYVEGGFPGNLEDPGRQPYLVAHNLLISHAKAVDLYKTKYKKLVKGGEIGITLDRVYMVPLSKNLSDVIAADRATDFQFGWFMHPITFGDYPESMKDLVKDRLPTFDSEESEMLKGSYDFLGLNYYTSSYVTDVPPTPVPHYTTDGCFRIMNHKDGIPIGKPTASAPPMQVTPERMRDILVDIKEKYENPLIYITENGTPDPLTAGIDDDERIDALKKHLFYLKMAKELGVNVKGYFVWSFLDNYEWSNGYTVRYGICHVDFNNGALTRTLKKSGQWYKKFLTE